MTLAALFASGRVVDVALLLMAGEAAALALPGRGPGLRALAANLASGACLLLALRVALVGGWWGWVAACLTGGLLAHAADLRGRWRRARERGRREVGAG